MISFDNIFAFSVVSRIGSCNVIVDGIKSTAKLRITPKITYKKNDKLQNYLKDNDGKDIMEAIRCSQHPRTGTAKWKYVRPDLRPAEGEYWSPRGIGYDLSGFVKSKQAGERLLQIVKEVLL